MSGRTTTSAPLVVDSLTVRYGKHTAVDRVSLAAEAGTVYALLGRNGAGKTSLVRCLLGHRQAHRGRALLFGQDVWRWRGRLMASVGVVPEQPDAPPSMSPRQLGAFCARLYPSWDPAAYGQRLARLGIPLDLPFGRLSKGQKSQVALGIALTPRPRLLVLDDPTLGLDAVARRSIYDELIDELAERGTTVFLATHDLGDVEGLAERVGFLHRGRLLVDEPLEALKRRYRRLKALQPEPDPGWLERVRPLAVASHAWGTEAVVDNFDEAVLGGRLGASLEVESLSLEEIFVALVGEGELGGER